MTETVHQSAMQPEVPQGYDHLVAEQSQRTAQRAFEAYSDTLDKITDVAASYTQVDSRFFRTLVVHGINPESKAVFKEVIERVIESVAEKSMREGFLLGLNAEESGGANGSGDSE